MRDPSEIQLTLVARAVVEPVDRLSAGSNPPDDAGEF